MIIIKTNILFSDDAFFGEVTDVNVWDKTLTGTEIESAMASCGHAAQGNVVSWRAMSMADLVGTSIQIPSLCDGTSLFICVQVKRLMRYNCRYTICLFVNRISQKMPLLIMCHILSDWQCVMFCITTDTDLLRCS